jgi:hypothetical protein
MGFVIASSKSGRTQCCLHRYGYIREPFSLSILANTGMTPSTHGGHWGRALGNLQGTHYERHGPIRALADAYNYLEQGH